MKSESRLLALVFGPSTGERDAIPNHPQAASCAGVLAHPRNPSQHRLWAGGSAGCWGQGLLPVLEGGQLELQAELHVAELIDKSEALAGIARL